MPGPAMHRAVLVYQYQRVGIEGRVAIAFAADMSEACAMLAL